MNAFSAFSSGLTTDKSENLQSDLTADKPLAAASQKTEKEENLAYPFGGWTDEENYR